MIFREVTGSYARFIRPVALCLNNGARPQAQKLLYVSQSVGIAAGMLMSAIHVAGLVTVTHTPSPMGFPNRILGRPPTGEALSHSCRGIFGSCGVCNGH